MSEKIISPISLRFPAELRKNLEDAAKQAQRSLNAEIRMRLERSFDSKTSDGPTNKMLASEIEVIRSELREFKILNKEEMEKIKEIIREL